MKKLIILFSVATLCGCNELQKSEGAKNAEQYVKEVINSSMMYSMDDVKSIDAEDNDSLLSDRNLVFANFAVAQKGNKYVQGEITREEYEESLDEYRRLVNDMDLNWQFNGVDNDSLMSLDKYKDSFRKVYRVTVTMKSGQTKEIRVLMDKDGITPRYTEKEVEEEIIREHSGNISQQMDYLY